MLLDETVVCTVFCSLGLLGVGDAVCVVLAYREPSWWREWSLGGGLDCSESLALTIPLLLCRVLDSSLAVCGESCGD